MDSVEGYVRERAPGFWMRGEAAGLPSAASTKLLAMKKAGHQGQSSRILDEFASPVPSPPDVVRQEAALLFSLPGTKCLQASARCSLTPHPKPRRPFPDCVSLELECLLVVIYAVERCFD